jgi:hypothetical protein
MIFLIWIRFCFFLYWDSKPLLYGFHRLLVCVLLIVLVHLRDHVSEQLNRFPDIVTVHEFLVFLARDLRVHFNN